MGCLLHPIHPSIQPGAGGGGGGPPGAVRGGWVNLARQNTIILGLGFKLPQCKGRWYWLNPFQSDSLYRLKISPAQTRQFGKAEYVCRNIDG